MYVHVRGSGYICNFLIITCIHVVTFVKLALAKDNKVLRTGSADVHVHVNDETTRVCNNNSCCGFWLIRRAEILLVR